QTIAKNAAWLMVATTGQKIISFLTFTFIARFVGVEITGKYFFAVSVTSIFVILADLGLTPVVIREMAADAERGRAVLASALRLKWILIPFAILSSLAYILLTHGGQEMLLAVALACLVMSSDAVSLTWYGAIRGRQQLRYEAWGMFIGQCLTAIVSLTAIFFHAGVLGLIFGLFCGSAWNVIWSITHTHRLLHSHSALPITHYPLRLLLRAALPFALAGIFVKVYSYVDTLLLKQFHDVIAVGYYSVAYKLVYSFQFLPMTFVAALYPGMSAASAVKDHQALRTILRGSMRLMMLLAIPITVGLSALAPGLIHFLYGARFSGAADALMILPWVTIPLFLDFPIGSLLNATHRAHQKTIAMGITMIVSIIANVMLVPAYGPVGAAWAGVISFWMLFLIGVWFVRHDIDWAWGVPFFLRGIIIAFIGWLVLKWLAGFFSIIPLIAVAIVLIVFLLWIGKIFVPEDFHLMQKWFKKIE
ncbi:MAG: flippase, partial [Candidatus Uhrbacteria bacterium]|nr:flippase [Candidatus Uhrbacteria bacterium]